MTPATARAAGRNSSLRSTIALAAACALACGLPAARGADAPALAWATAHAGDHVRYRVHECWVRQRDDTPAGADVPAPRCNDRDIEVSVLSVDADGRARARWIARGPTGDPGVAALAQGTQLPKRAIAQGVPLELSIGADGEIAVADAATFRALVKRFAESLPAAPTVAGAAQVQRIVKHLEAMSDLELFDAVANDAKILYTARLRPLVASSALDDVQELEQDILPVRMEMNRHVAVSALSADGQGIQQTTTSVLDQEHATALVETMIEKMRARGMLSTPAEEARAREVIASPMSMHSSVVTTIDLRHPWPTGISQVFETDFMHVQERHEQTWTPL